MKVCKGNDIREDEEAMIQAPQDSGKPQTQEDIVVNMVAYFASNMRNQLWDNMHKGGWRDNDTASLVRRYLEESGEFIEALLQGKDQLVLEKEAADCANFLMMIIDPSRKPKP